MERSQLRNIATGIDTERLPKAIHNAPVSSSLSTLLTTIEQKLTPKQLSSIQAIGLAIGGIGLSLDDASLQNRVTREELDNMMLYCPEVRTYLNLKQVEYKAKLLEVVTKHATTNGDVKIAMWLLEKHYGDEYDSSLKKDLAKMNNNMKDDVVEMAFAFVRKSSINTMPVNTEVGDEEKREVIKVHDVMDGLV